MFRGWFCGSVLPNERGQNTILSWCGEPEVQLSCSPGGQLYFQKVSLPTYQMIRLPRQWDDPQRRDPRPAKDLVEFFHQVKEALQGLGRHIG